MPRSRDSRTLHTRKGRAARPPRGTPAATCSRPRGERSARSVAGPAARSAPADRWRTVRPPAVDTRPPRRAAAPPRSEEHTSELQSHSDLVCRLLLEKKKQYKMHKKRRIQVTQD